jgi:hypothetical protein
MCFCRISLPMMAAIRTASDPGDHPPAVAAWHHFGSAMTNGPEKTLIEALKKVEMHGDVAPPHVHDPMTMALRESAIQASLMRWDDTRGRYVLTGAGRRRISESGRATGTILSFRKRDVLGGGLPHRKPACTDFRE